MNPTRRPFPAALAVVVSLASLAGAQDPAPRAGDQPAANVIEGPAVADIGSNAKMELTADYRALGPKETQEALRRMGNLNVGGCVALVAPKAEDQSWFIVFKFEECGYVKDDDRESLDAGALLEAIKNGDESANSDRAKAGLPAQHTKRWAIPPHYDSTTNNLEWAFVFESEGRECVNFWTKLLGRRGVMHVALVCDPPDLEATLPAFRSAMKGFRYVDSEAYAAYRKGDRIAEYTLGALVAGGAVAVLAKTGLLAKLWKPIALGFVAVCAFIGRLFKRRKKQAPGASADPQALHFRQ